MYIESSALTRIAGFSALCIGEPADVPAIRRALTEAGARLLDFTIETDGLRVEAREAERVTP